MKIGVDIDEVLFPFTDNLLLFYNNKHGTSIKKSDIYVYEFYKVLGVSKDEELSDIIAFTTSQMFKEMKPIEGTVEGIKELRKNNDLYILTGRSNHTKDTTYNQIAAYFNGSFKGIYLSEFSIKTGFKTPKFQFCKELGIELMVEDIAGSAIEISKECNIPVLVPKYPWNKKAEFSGTKCVHVDGWKGIMDYCREIGIINS